MNNNILDSFGKRLRFLRYEHGLTQKELRYELKKLGISVGQSYISEMENSSKIPSGTIIIGLAKILGTTTDYLLLLTDIPFMPTNNLGYTSEETNEIICISNGLPLFKRRELLEIARIMKKYYENNE